MRNSAINIETIIKVAKALGELNECTVFVGGAVTGLYANDSASDDIRPTKDVDIIFEIATLLELEELREKLNQKGFRQTVEDNVTCRFRFEDIKVDVMSTQATGWAPANKWFAPGFDKLVTIDLKKTEIQILPLEYFLATKFVAFADRGKSDPFGSHDFEDIIYLLDNRTDLVDIIKNAAGEVSAFVKEYIRKILVDRNIQEAILGNLPYQTQQKRYDIIMEKLQNIIGINKM